LPFPPHFCPLVFFFFYITFLFRQFIKEQFFFSLSGGFCSLRRPLPFFLWNQPDLPFFAASGFPFLPFPFIDLFPADVFPPMLSSSHPKRGSGPPQQSQSTQGLFASSPTFLVLSVPFPLVYPPSNVFCWIFPEALPTKLVKIHSWFFFFSLTSRSSLPEGVCPPPPFLLSIFFAYVCPPPPSHPLMEMCSLAPEAAF